MAGLLAAELRDLSLQNRLEKVDVDAEQLVEIAKANLALVEREAAQKVDKAKNDAIGFGKNANLMRRRAEVVREMMSDQNRSALVDRVSHAVSPTPASEISGFYREAARECFDNFRDALYRVTIAQGASDARTWISIAIALGGIAGMYTFKSEIGNVGSGAACLVGMLGSQAERSPTARSVVNFFTAPLRIPFSHFARKRFMAVNERVLREQFTVLWKSLLSPASLACAQQIPTFENFVTEICAPHNNVDLTLGSAQIALIRSLAADLRSISEKSDLGGLLKGPVEALPLRNMRGLLTKAPVGSVMASVHP